MYATPRFSADGASLEDRDLAAVGGPVDVSGGWFDAGDFLKFTHTAAYAVVQLLFIATSVLRGGADGRGGRDGGPDDRVPPAVTAGGPVLDARTGGPVSLDIPRRTVALTFDDGPDPAWTPQILRILAAEKVPATFFVTGEHVARHPELVRAQTAAGHEVGLRTFTHTDLATTPDRRMRLELAASRAVLAGATRYQHHAPAPAVLVHAGRRHQPRLAGGAAHWRTRLPERPVHARRPRSPSSTRRSPFPPSSAGCWARSPCSRPPDWPCSPWPRECTGGAPPRGPSRPGHGARRSPPSSPPTTRRRPSPPACARSWTASDPRSTWSWSTTDPPTARRQPPRRVADPRVWVVTQPNRGKPAALNAGVAHAAHDVILMVDADTVIAPGAIGAFRRAALASCGDISPDTLAEDTDIAMALCRQGRRVVYRSGAHGLPHVPATVRDLWHQRHRWAYGTLQSLWKHRHAVREAGIGGRLGRRTLPYLVLFHSSSRSPRPSWTPSPSTG